MILGGIMIGLGAGLMSKPSDTKKTWKPKKRRKEKDIFFGTPLERF